MIKREVVRKTIKTSEDIKYKRYSKEELINLMNGMIEEHLPKCENQVSEKDIIFNFEFVNEWDYDGYVIRSFLQVCNDIVVEETDEEYNERVLKIKNKRSRDEIEFERLKKKLGK